MSTPDVEALLLARLAPLGGIKLFAYESVPMMHALGERTSIQVDVRASSKQRARDRAYVARDSMLAMPGEDFTEAVVNWVEIESGPAWLPDPDGAPRYVLRATLHYHERRSATQVLH